MTIQGIGQFCGYIFYIYFRWVRVTHHRYGLRGVLISSYRPRHRGTGTGVRANPYGRAHDVHTGTRVWYILRQLDLERAHTA